MNIRITDCMECTCNIYMYDEKKLQRMKLSVKFNREMDWTGVGISHIILFIHASCRKCSFIPIQ